MKEQQNSLMDRLKTNTDAIVLNSAQCAFGIMLLFKRLQKYNFWLKITK